jgi:eukaryotic-like serine/threonine-protein kinase
MAAISPQLKAIFCEALDCQSDVDRQAYLNRACNGDAGLRSQIEVLLVAHQDLGEFLEEPAQAVSWSQPPLVEAPGTVIGPFELLEQIGEGGMGVVYVALQTNPVRREVALKIIKPGMDTKQVIARFEAERQTLAMMDHPNIAKVHDAGTTVSGRSYFVMELVRGVPITDFCDREQLSIAARLELFVLVCRAVQHAHQKGIIHRDIKPSNILVTLIDGAAVPKVIDFGVAKATGASLTERTVDTGVHQFVGTPLYMSPEQADLSGTDMDTRSDIYSLGVLLYELLTGTTPFDADALTRVAFDDMRRIIREDEPPKPSTRLSSLGATRTIISANRKTDARQLDRTVRGELDWIVMKALEKDRRRRYETANDFAADVNRHLSDKPVDACQPSTTYRFRKFARRNRAVLCTATMVMVALTASTTISAWHAFRAIRAERGTAAALTEARRWATQSQAIGDFLIEDLIAAAGRSQNMGAKTPVEEVLARADATVATRYAQQPLVEAAIRHVLGRSYLELGRHQKAEQHLNRAIELRRSYLGPEHPDTLASLFELTGMLHMRGFWDAARQQEAAALCRQVADAQRRVLGPDHPDTIESLQRLGFILRVAGRPEEAFALFQKTYDAQARLWGPEDPRTLNSLHGLGSAQWTLGHREEALDLHLQVLALRLRVQPADHPQVIWTLKDLFMESWEMGRIDDGAQLREQLMDRHERIYGLCDPKLACVVSMMYRTLKDLGRWDCVRMTSERWLTKLVRQTPEVEGSATDPEWQRHRAEMLGQLVWQLVTLPEPNGIDVETCVRAAEEAYAVNPDSTHVDNYSRYASARTVLGMVHYRAGAWEKAIATLDRGGEIRGADDGFNQLILAMAHARLGDLLQARTWFEKASQWQEELPDRNEWLERLRAEAKELLRIAPQDEPPVDS